MGMAVVAFRRTAIGAFRQVLSRGLRDDWQQEMALAAWRCERDRLSKDDAWRLLARAAYHAMKHLGFRRTKRPVTWQWAA
jgi:hypothetical protein